MWKSVSGNPTTKRRVVYHAFMPLACRVQVLNLSQLEYASTPMVHKKYYDSRAFFIIYYKMPDKDKTQEEFTIGQNVLLLFFIDFSLFR